MLAPVAVRHVRPAFVVAGGLVLTAAGLGLVTQVDGESDLALIVAASVVIALGVAPPVTLATDLIVGCVPPERAGVASGISETGAELGGALGIALLGSIGVAVYRGEVADAVPSGLSSGKAEAAEETLGGALEVVEGLGGDGGTTLLEAAQEAFVQGMQVAAVAAAAVALGTALVAAVFLRRRGSGGPPERPLEAAPDAAMEAASP
jgi:DHA2 family multidrug resistance protein-like MFS transporter